MVKLNDIYFKMNSNIIMSNYLNADIEGKKNVIDEELKKYVYEKIYETGKFLKRSEVASLSTTELVRILGEQIPENQHDSTLSHLTHYILGVASALQSYAIIWYQENDDNLINEPKIEINGEVWDSIKTHSKTSYVQTFTVTYDEFQNNFMKSNNKQLKLTDNK